MSKVNLEAFSVRDYCENCETHSTLIDGYCKLCRPHAMARKAHYRGWDKSRSGDWNISNQPPEWHDACDALMKVRRGAKAQEFEEPQYSEQETWNWLEQGRICVPHQYKLDTLPDGWSYRWASMGLVTDPDRIDVCIVRSPSGDERDY